MVPVGRTETSGRLRRAVLALAVLLGLLGMHGLVAPHGTASALMLHQPEHVTGMHDAASADDAASSDNSQLGCDTAHAGCLAVLRAATFVPPPVDVAPAPVMAALKVQMGLAAREVTSRAPPPIVDLLELCVCRT